MSRCGTETVNGVAPHLSFELGIPLRNENSRGRDARVTFCSTWWKAVESLAPGRPRESHLSKLFLEQMRVQRKSKSDVVEFHFHSDSVTPAMPRHAVCGRVTKSGEGGKDFVNIPWDPKEPGSQNPFIFCLPNGISSEIMESNENQYGVGIPSPNAF